MAAICTPYRLWHAATLTSSSVSRLRAVSVQCFERSPYEKQSPGAGITAPLLISQSRIPSCPANSNDLLLVPSRNTKCHTYIAAQNTIYSKLLSRPPIRVFLMCDSRIIKLSSRPGDRVAVIPQERLWRIRPEEPKMMSSSQCCLHYE